MNKRLISVWLFLLAGTLVSLAQDSIFNTIKSELQRNFDVLKEEPIPVYYTFVRLDDLQSISATANLGALQSEAVLGSPSRILTTGLRVGDYLLDNSHEMRESGYGSSGISIGGSYLPYEANNRSLRNAIWSSLDQLYKEGIQNYEQVKANMAVKVKQEDKSPDFSEEKVNNYYEQAINWNSLGVDPKVWEEKVRRYSKIFDENDEIRNGTAFISASLARTIFIDTEGREMAQNSVKFQLFLSANTVAEDGMYLPLYRSWMSHSIGELPSDAEVLAAAREISATLSALRKAPVVESFTGPAILSPAASGVFFHEIFGHRVEGARLKKENDAQTFKKKIGETVLPKHISITFDPTIDRYLNMPLMGNYHFDDEGIRSQRVEVVKNGILKDFLMSRTPIEGFLHSNGHGRGSIGMAPVARQSNMLVESSKSLSDDELFKQLRKEAKSQGKKYAYYFKEVSGGFTNTTRYSPNSFNVTPLVVYRIYVDGRPDELVRGVDMVGTPLAMFSQIAACGNKSSVFNGICGAESGGVPVSCVSPALLVKRIETQKKPKSQSQPILLPKPQEEIENTNLSDETVLFQALKKEVDRNLELKMDDLQAPFFISYTISDIKTMNVVASFGSLMSSDIERGRSSGSRLLIGDYQCTDENFQGTAGGSSGYDGSPTLDDNEKIIRNTIWKDLDAIYKHAAETYEQKTATIKQLNIPAKELELPDWDKTPVVKMTDLPMKSIDFTKKNYEDYAKKASAVFNDYPEFLDSYFSVLLMQGKAYFYNTEGSEIIYPLTYACLRGGASGKNAEGEDFSDSFTHIFSTPDEFPSLEQIQKECHQLAKNLIEEIHAQKMIDSYSGPVLFEGLTIPDLFYGNFFGSDISLIADRKPLTTEGFSYGGNSIEEMMNKRITAREITIEDLTGTSEYQGVKLLGYAPVDAQGVIPPEKLTLVEKGILVNLLSDRVPSPKTPHSNGHSLFTAGLSATCNTGVIRLSDTRTKAYTDLKKELLERAQEEGYEYAYIVREIAGLSSPTKLYQVNTRDGSEKRIRSAELNNMDSQIFKKIIGVSDKELIYNTVRSNLITIITPNAILFDDMQIQSDRVDNFQKAPLVPAPGVE